MAPRYASLDISMARAAPLSGTKILTSRVGLLGDKLLWKFYTVLYNFVAFSTTLPIDLQRIPIK